MGSQGTWLPLRIAGRWPGNQRATTRPYFRLVNYYNLPIYIYIHNYLLLDGFHNICLLD